MPIADGNDIRSSSIPVLETGSLSYPMGTFDLESRKGGHEHALRLTHRLSGAPLIQELIDSGDAVFACVIASPRAAYRKLFVCGDFEQEVVWEPNELCGLPVFTPLVLATRNVERVLDSKTDGTHMLWDGSKVTFQEGAKLAIGQVKYLAASNLQSLIVIVPDSRLNKLGMAQIIVEASTSEDFYFRVRCQTKLAEYLAGASSSHTDKQADILVHIVTSCLALLQRQFAEDDGEMGWKSFMSLRALSAEMERRGMTGWYDPSFRPEEAATILHPHPLVAVGENDE